MYGFDTGTTQGAFQRKIEIRCIHSDKYIRRIGKKIIPHLATDFQYFREATQDLGNSHHCKLLHRIEKYATRILQARTAYPGNLNIIAPFFQGVDQVGGKHVAGNLASNYTYTQHGQF